MRALLGYALSRVVLVIGILLCHVVTPRAWRLPDALRCGQHLGGRSRPSSAPTQADTSLHALSLYLSAGIRMRGLQHWWPGFEITAASVHGNTRELGILQRKMAGGDRCMLQV